MFHLSLDKLRYFGRHAGHTHLCQCRSFFPSNQMHMYKCRKKSHRCKSRHFDMANLRSHRYLFRSYDLEWRKSKSFRELEFIPNNARSHLLQQHDDIRDRNCSLRLTVPPWETTRFAGNEIHLSSDNID